MSDKPKSRLIYEGRTVHVREELIPGQDFVFIAFNNGADVYPEANRYWGDEFFPKNNLSVIGISAREANWFPPDDMEKAIEAIRPYLKGRRVITYGTSMGGYAAAKFSAALGAERALVFSPQWSILPDEAGNYDPKHPWQYWHPDIGGGGAVKPEDVAGELFIFCDPGEKSDWIHCDNIVDAIARSPHNARAHRIVAPMTWHGPLFHLVSSKGMTRKLLDLVRAPALPTAQQFRQLFRSSRRSSTYYRDTRRMIIMYRMMKGPQHRGLMYDLLEQLDHLPEIQENRLARICVTWLQGREQEAVERLKEEIAFDGLWSTTFWGMDRIWGLVRVYRMVELERLMRICYLRRCTLDEMPKAVLDFAKVMHEIGIPEEGEREVLAFLDEHPEKLFGIRKSLLEVAKLIGSAPLREKALEMHILARTRHILACRRAKTSSPTLAVVFMEANLDDREQLATQDSAFSILTEGGEVETLCLFSSAKFPPEEMKEISAAIRKHANGRPLIVQGEQWNGYAALRYSGQLGADWALGLRYERKDEPHVFVGAGPKGTDLVVETPPLRSEDLSPRAFVACEPREWPDNVLTRELTDNTHAQRILTYYCWGNAWQALLDSGEEGRQRLLALVKSPKDVTLGAMRGIVRDNRRQTPFYLDQLEGRLHERFERSPSRSPLLQARDIDWNMSPRDFSRRALLEHFHGNDEKAIELLKAFLGKTSGEETRLPELLLYRDWAYGRKLLHDEIGTQGARLVMACAQWLSGEEDNARKTIKAEVQRNRLAETSAFARHFLLEAIKRHKMAEPAQLLLPALLVLPGEEEGSEQERDRFLHTIETLHELGQDETLEELVSSWLSLHPDFIEAHREQLLHAAHHLDSVALRAGVTGARLLAETPNIMALRKGQPGSASVGVVFVCGELERYDRLALRVTALDHLTVANGIDTVCIYSPTLFPPEEMGKVVKAVQAYAAGRPIVTLGEHWGGYAALRYSGQLGAHSAVSIRYMQEDGPHRFADKGPGGTELVVNTPALKAKDMAPHAFVVCDFRQWPESHLTSRLIEETHAKRIITPFMWSMPERAILHSGEKTTKQLLEFIKEPQKAAPYSLRKAVRDGRLDCEYYVMHLRGRMMERFRQHPWASPLLQELLKTSLDKEALFIRALLEHLMGNKEAAQHLVKQALEQCGQEEDTAWIFHMYRNWSAGIKMLEAHF